MKVNFDWTINLTHVASFVSCLAAGLIAYTDLKSEVRNNRTLVDAKIVEYDRQFSLQRGIDNDQDTRMLRAVNQIGETVRDLKADVRADLKDLRSDLGRTTRAPAPSTIFVPSPRLNERERERGG